MSTDQRPLKKVEESKSETMRVVMHADANAQGRIFGGRLMEWIDMVGGIAAIRHCGGPVTTACVDKLNFLAPAYVGDVVVMQGRVTYVGNTSCEVRVESHVENVKTGERHLINTAYLTEVLIGEDGHIKRIPYDIDHSDPELDREWHAAQNRKELRAARRESGI